MRTSVFALLAIVVAACSSIENTTDTSSFTSSILRPPERNQLGADTLYEILIRNGYDQNTGERVRITVLTNHMVDTSAPDVKVDYIAALVEKTGTQKASIAVFDPSQKMKVVGYVSQEFPDAMYFGAGGNNPSGQGSDLSAYSVKLSDGGDVIAVAARSSKQFYKNVDEDEDVWLYALYKNEIVMIHAFSLRFTHHLTGENFSKDVLSHTHFILSKKRTHGMFDLLLKTQVDESGSGGFRSTRSEEAFAFNGKEYTRKE